MGGFEPPASRLKGELNMKQIAVHFLLQETCCFSALTTELHHTRIIVPIVGIEPTPSRILTGDFCVFQDLQTAFQTLDVIILTRL